MSRQEKKGVEKSPKQPGKDKGKERRSFIWIREMLEAGRVGTWKEVK